MPLKISIDVDDTLVDRDGNLVPNAVRGLTLLKDAGHSLQLWSAGGAEHCIKTAHKHGIAGFFTSFAAKHDVILDDLPIMARPAAIVLVNTGHSFMRSVEKALKLETTVDAAQTVGRESIQFIERLQCEADQIRQDHGVVLRKDIPLHPVPFFGAIQQARVITVGLNPSSTEFEEAGRWPEQLSAENLAKRLLDYFRDPIHTPHHWFADLQQAMSYIHCPYHLCAAHVDVSPWTTYAPTTLAKWDREAGTKGYPRLQSYNILLDDGLNRWLPETLRLCNSSLQLVIACSSDEPKQSEQQRLNSLALVVQAELGKRWATNQFVVLPKREVAEWVWKNRNDLTSKLDLENVYT